MARLRDFLTRFRPLGSPGAAATGVPADRAAELEAELAPALAQLTRAQEEVAAIRATAAGEAERIRQEATREAARILDEARARAPQVRADSAVSARHTAEAQAAELLAAAERAAARVRDRAGERMPAMADRVADLALGGPEEPRRSRWAPAGSAG